MSTWGSDDDPTARQPLPQPPTPSQAAYRRAERADSIMVALIVLLTFVLGTVVMMTTIYTLYNTVDRLIAVPVCREAR